jgi:hypothetical protein
MPGKNKPGPSVMKPKTYEALRDKGMSKERSANRERAGEEVEGLVPTRVVGREARCLQTVDGASPSATGRCPSHVNNGWHRIL